VRRKRDEDESENTDRWLISYADFVTLLFAFFVVMYAMSSVNDGKFRVLSDTMVAAFKTPPKSNEPIQIGEQRKTLKPIEGFLEKPNVVKIIPDKIKKTSDSQKIVKRLKKSFQPLMDKNLIKITEHKLWVEVELSDRILFTSGESELQAEAFEVLQKLASVLKGIPNHVDVEGHTDNLPIRNNQYRSNWELSATRAASVVHLLTLKGVQPERLSAIGYGEYRPVVKNSTRAGRQRNRRVSLIILADKNARRMLEINQ
jgi:chemotaxis protein MotB